VQAAAWLGVIAVYTVGLVLVLGGGGGDDGPKAAREDWSATEKKVAAIIEGPPTKERERGDVPAFRTPQVTKVDCKDGTCAVEYTLGLTGNGRIVEDQQQMLATLFEDESLQKISLRVVRATAAGPNVPLKPVEETPAGVMILVNTCVRTEKATALPDEQLDLPAFPAACETVLNNDIGTAQRDAGRAASEAPSQGNGANGSGLLGDRP
jgi:hypothetical protein